MFFDTSTIGNMSVYTNFIEPLEAMAIVRSYKIAGNKTVKRPPYITLSWGKSSYFVECILKKIDYEFKMFTRDGLPIRANVNLSFEEIMTDSTKEAVVKKQASAQTYVTKEGETLYEIAEKTYKDSNKWKIIATANEVDNPFKVPAGVTLQLPAIS
jgi:LysM repeat protein